MKKIYSIALAAVAILSAASCQKELVNDNFDAAGEKFTVTAVASADSKTVLEGNTSYWTPGDKITVFNAEGQPVAFDTDITEKAASAKFTNTTDFTAPAELLAVYPDRDDVQVYENGIINNFRVAGTQTAVAGSFDPTMAGAVGTPKAEGSTELVFNNIHCLVKFTVGGETAPSTVKLINNSGKMIAGLYKYDVVNKAVINEGAASAITLTGPFEVGQTYYIAAIPYDVKTTLTLQFDGEDVKTSGEVTLEPNKIYNLGTLPAPAEEPEPEPAGEKVIWEGSHDTAGWSGNQDLAWGGYDWATVAAGQRLKVYVTPNDPSSDWWCISLRSAGTNWPTLVGAKEQYDKCSYSVTIDLTEETLADLVANNGLILTGSETTVNKVTLLPADAENVIWAGEAESTGYSNCTIGQANDLVNNGVAAGDKLKIYVTAGETWALQMYDGQWNKWFGTAEDGSQEGTYGHGWSNYNTDLTNGYVEFELTEEMVTAYAGFTWGNLVILQGDAVKITKISLN